jgi:hypothetical protein
MTARGFHPAILAKGRLRAALRRGTSLRVELPVTAANGDALPASAT